MVADFPLSRAHFVVSGSGTGMFFSTYYLTSEGPSGPGDMAHNTHSGFCCSFVGTIHDIPQPLRIDFVSYSFSIFHFMFLGSNFPFHSSILPIGTHSSGFHALLKYLVKDHK